MNDLSLLLWLLPILLIFLFIKRLSVKSNSDFKSDSLSSQNIKNNPVWFYIFLVSAGIITLFYGYKYLKGNNLESGSATEKETSACMNETILPEDFTGMIDNDANFSAEIFKNKKYEREVSTKDSKKGTSLIFNNFIEIERDSIDKSSIVVMSFENDSMPSHITYILYSSECYQLFQEEFLKLKLDTIDINQYKELQTFKKQAFKYKNCVFILTGFNMNNDSYLVDIYNYNLLHAVKPPKKKVQDLVDEEFYDYSFLNEAKYRAHGDFIRFLISDANGTISFSGEIDFISLNGEVQITNDGLKVISGNCTGNFKFIKDNSILIGTIKTGRDLSFELELEK